jgi:hypothetical protein
MTSIDHKRRDLQVLPSKLLSPLITAMVYRNNDRMAKRQLLLQYIHKEELIKSIYHLASIF